MVESIANIVRAWPAERIRDGQPYVALELICGTRPQRRGRRWSGRSTSAASRGSVARARRRDQRHLPRRPARPRPRRRSPARAPGALREPGYVMRFRKERSFVYSLIADGEEQASSPLEQIARAQVAVGAPSIVRFQLTPTPSFFEELARRLYRHHEQQARAPGTLGTARGRADVDVQPRRDARRRAHPEPQPVLARDRHRRRHAARRARRSPPPCSRAAARTACTAAG